MIRRLALAAVLFSASASAQQIYDLLIKHGQVVDPADEKQGRFDIAIVGSRIVQLGADISPAQARVVVDADGYYVTPGLIDINTHVNIRAGGSNVYPDYNALRSGVTTVVDAGGSNSVNFEAFKSQTIDRAKTRVLAFLNIEPDAQAAAGLVAKYPGVIVGLTVADPSAQDSQAVRNAIETAIRARTVLMLDSTAGLDDLALLRPGDIYTHIYRQWSTPNPDTLWRGMKSANQKGVLLDVGAGSNAFWYSSAVPAIHKGILPDTISTGMEKASMLLPGTNMASMLSKFLNMGMTFDQIIERTTLNAARAIKHPELGTLREGAPADIALFKIERGTFGLLDSGLTRLDASRRVQCVLTVRNGAIVWDSDGLAAVDWIKAGPYTNFK